MGSLGVKDATAPDPEHRKHALTPPTSEEGNKADGSSSDLSDLELDDEEEEIEPDHYWGEGKIPVFKPNMDQFRDFEKFVSKIDKFGMRAGIVKVIPPKEWHDSLPQLDEAVKTIRVKNPIVQEFSGTHGTYTQANIEKQRSYNLPQWKALTDESQHQPPTRRGERRKNVGKPKPPARSSSAHKTGASTGEQSGRPGRGRPPKKVANENTDSGADAALPTTEDDQTRAPPTPTSPNTAPTLLEKPKSKRKSTAGAGRPRGDQKKSVSERRKYNQQEVVEDVDEEAFKEFDYRFPEAKEFTPERCTELENQYWRSLTFAPPMYGADMPGSLFEDSCTSWNVAHLPNILDVLGQKVPGVNTAYLYLGMWKATYAWHLEDVDLYSINYIHFGAPKQWYSISQEDARRFEAAMRTIWPNDAKHCSQFLRHKTYLVSPALLEQQFNIKVNRLVHYEGEFVITFPYGYHSGYNLGYNCAESVNFATEGWLDFGRIAKKCECEADSVWINTDEIERKLRGEPTPEYYEETDDEEEEEAGNLPSPPPSVVGGNKSTTKKRKRDSVPSAPSKRVKIKIMIKKSKVEPCCLCPNDRPNQGLLPTDDGRQAHRICAEFTPETFIWLDEQGSEIICNIAGIDKARMDLKCMYCRSKKGSCFQCSERKCTRAYHATCADPAGVRVDTGMTSHYADGIEYKREGCDFRCRWHRPKRPKTITSDALEADMAVEKTARKLEKGSTIQIQYWTSEIFAGVVVENRPGEKTVLVDTLPEGDQVEISWRWILVNKEDDSKLIKPSANAQDLPPAMVWTTLKGKTEEFNLPAPDDPFTDTPDNKNFWSEFNPCELERNPFQQKCDLNKETQPWHYIGEISTEVRSQFTNDPRIRKNHPASNFLSTVQPPAPIGQPRRPSQISNAILTPLKPNSKNPRPYEYKPKFDPFMHPLPVTKDIKFSTSYNNTNPPTKSPRPTPIAPRPASHHTPTNSQSYSPNSTSPSNNRPNWSPILATSPPIHQAPKNQDISSAKLEQTPTKLNTSLAASSAQLAQAQASTVPPSDALANSASSQEYLHTLDKYPYYRVNYLRRPEQYVSPFKEDSRGVRDQHDRAESRPWTQPGLTGFSAWGTPNGTSRPSQQNHFRPWSAGSEKAFVRADFESKDLPFPLDSEEMTRAGDSGKSVVKAEANNAGSTMETSAVNVSDAPELSTSS